MPSSYDSVHAIACESAAEGGTQTRTSPTEIDPQQDALALAGIHLVGTGVVSTDKTVYVDRTNGLLRLTDTATQRLLSELVTSVTAGVNSHASLRDIQHFLAGEGPGDGFASGAVMSRSYSNGLVSQETWFASNAMANKIVQRTYAYGAGSPLASSCTWLLYAASGAVIRTLVQTFSYSGPSLTGETRTWS